MNYNYNKYNLHLDFDDLVNEKLGNYVYGLFDPKDGLPFYIGKGGGKQKKGNQRILHHFDEARSSYADGDGDSVDSKKIARIREIWKRGKNVDCRIISHGLPDEQSSLHVEASVIDILKLIPGIRLTNIQGGHYSSLIENLQELYAWQAKPFSSEHCHDALCERPIFLFPIKNSYDAQVRAHQEKVGRIVTETEARELAEEATRRAWSVANTWRNESRGIALGLINGIARSAINIESWKECPEYRGKYEINGTTLTNKEELNLLLMRNFFEITKICNGYWKRGNYLVFKILKDKRYEIMRGLGSGPIDLRR